MTVQISVPSRPPLPGIDAIQSGKPVRGVTWSAYAELFNWVLAQGTTVIPAHSPVMATRDTAGDIDLSFRIWTRSYAVTRLWVFQMSQGRWQIEIPAGGGVIADVFVRSGTARTPLVMVQETVASPVDGESTIDVRLTCEDAAGGQIKHVACYEAPRAFLENGTTASANTEHGVLSESMTPQEQIFFDSANAGNSFGAVANTALLAVPQLHRGGMYYFTAGGDAGAVQIAAAGPVNFFPGWPIFLGPKWRIADTLSTLKVRITAKCTDGSTGGRVDFAMNSGDTLSITIPTSTTTYTEFPGASAEIDVHAEDLSTVDGRRAGTFDIMAIQGYRTAGSGSIFVRNIAIGHVSP